MKLKFILLLVSLSFAEFTYCQTIGDLIDQVSQQKINQIVRELSGENSTVVGGNTVVIQHRISSQDNNLSADYIKERLISFGLNTSAIDYSGSGRNIIATQIGTVNPNNIYIICGHYDSVASYGADDNASGVAAVLESARILSEYDFENTIIYALWDEEEVGLIGARNYANNASANNENILGVLNMDMLGYDGDNDKQYDIDVRNIANSYQIRDDLISIVSDHNLDLVTKVVDPGTYASDHSAFWDVGYSAVLLGEAWSDNDINPGYHTSNDRISLFNFNYFYNMVKLCVGYISTKGVLMKDVGLNPIDQFSATVYPNPTNGPVHIKFEEPKTGDLDVLNIYGELVSRKRVEGSQEVTYNLAGLANGVYIIRMINDKGDNANLRLIKE